MFCKGKPKENETIYFWLFEIIDIFENTSVKDFLFDGFYVVMNSVSSAGACISLKTLTASLQKRRAFWCFVMTEFHNRTGDATAVFTSSTI